MSITLLRTETCLDNNFRSDLCKDGKHRTENGLIELLNKKKYNNIYSSPAKRALLTITPYCELYGQKINIEPCLYDYSYMEIFHGVDTHYDLLLTSETHLSIDKNYRPIVSYINVDSNINNSVDLFINKLLSISDKSHDLIITHHKIIQSFLDYLNLSKIINNGELITINKDMFKVNNNIPSYY